LFLSYVCVVGEKESPFPLLTVCTAVGYAFLLKFQLVHVTSFVGFATKGKRLWQ